MSRFCWWANRLTWAVVAAATCASVQQPVAVAAEPPRAATTAPPSDAAPAANAPATATFSPADYLTVQCGSAPLIISAPHGGALELPGVPPRTGVGLERRPGGFVTTRDTGTEELAQAVARAVEQRLGAPPTLVASRTHRRYLDPNRPIEQGAEHDRSRAVHAAYYQALSDGCQRARERHGGGLLLDLHGQGSRRDTVFRGTQNGQTVALLRNRFGAEAVLGPASLFGLLRDRGWKVFPDPLEGKEQAGFTGGNIVRTFGGAGPHGIDAVQLEFGADYRQAAVRDKVAAELADAVADYCARYF